MTNIILMDRGEKSSDGVVEMLETHPDFVKEGYTVERVELRAACCPCGKWYHVFDLPGHDNQCPTCKTPLDSSMERVRVADFSDMAGTWALEKKLDNNLYSSLVNKEIYEQCEKMGVTYGDSGAVVLQGFMSLLVEKHPAQANWLWSIPAVCHRRYGIGFVVVEDDLGMAHMIDAYVKQARHEGTPTRFKVDQVKKKSRKMAALEAAEGVGDVIAIKAFNVFKNLKNIANASMLQLQEVFHKKTMNVYQLFNDNALDEIKEIEEELKARKEARKLGH